jgi:hypothetical protein
MSPESDGVSEFVPSADLPIGDETQESGHIAGTSLYRYGVYGVSLRSEIPLLLPEYSGRGLVEIKIRSAPACFFLDLTRATALERVGFCSYRYAPLDDGSAYVRWEGLGEFLVSPDGRLITCIKFPAAADESFQVYLLGQALSFALVKTGFEPLHATCVVVNRQAIAFLGDSGFGKSSLAACFLGAGDQLLTDDLLLVGKTSERLQAFPGPARIKLFPKMAKRFLGGHVNGVPMNQAARKLIIPLDPQKICACSVPLQSIYVLARAREAARERDVRIEQLSLREAFVALVSNTFNYAVLDRGRLKRQFTETSRLVQNVPVKKLFYSRLAGFLPSVREAILEDLGRDRHMA